MKSPCFIALTRPVSMMGLPLNYVVMLSLLVLGGFILTKSFLYLGVSAGLGYGGLRLLAAYDPRFFDVLFVSLQKTPLPPGWFKGKGIVYRA